jgi:hypothetical protein
VLNLGDGRTLTSAELVGATIELGGQHVMLTAAALRPFGLTP